MYYLEDKHPEKEYTLYIQVKGAVPYIGVWYATSMDQVYDKISEIEKRHKRYHQRFYIDNDFYVNQYTNSDYAYYYRFMEREVQDWQTLRTKNNIIKIVV